MEAPKRTRLCQWDQPTATTATTRQSRDSRQIGVYPGPRDAQGRLARDSGNSTTCGPIVADTGTVCFVDTVPAGGGRPFLDRHPRFYDVRRRCVAIGPRESVQPHAFHVLPHPAIPGRRTARGGGSSSPPGRSRRSGSPGSSSRGSRSTRSRRVPGSRSRPPPIPSQLRLTVGSSSLTSRSGGRSRAGEILVVLDSEEQRLALRESRTRRDGFAAKLEALRDQIAAEQEAASKHREARSVAIGELRAKVEESEARAKYAEFQLGALAKLRAHNAASLGGLPARSCGGRGASRRGEDEPARGGAAGTGA